MTRRTLILLVAILGISVLVILGARLSRQPSYQGKPLSAWLHDVDFDQQKPVQQHAGEALRSMGTNVLPFLIHDLTPQPELGFKLKLMLWARRWTGLKLQWRTQTDRSRQAVWAFRALGPLGRPALPALASLMEINSAFVPGAIAAIGPEALPYLLQAITNKYNAELRINTLRYLPDAIFAGSLPRAESGVLVPPLVSSLHDTNVAVRRFVPPALGAIAGVPELSIPALIRSLNDADSTVQEASIWALASFGKQASGAIPALDWLAKDPDLRIQTAARTVLHQITADFVVRPAPRTGVEKLRY